MMCKQYYGEVPISSGCSLAMLIIRLIFDGGKWWFDLNYSTMRWNWRSSLLLTTFQLSDGKVHWNQRKHKNGMHIWLPKVSFYIFISSAVIWRILPCKLITVRTWTENKMPIGGKNMSWCWNKWLPFIVIPVLWLFYRQLQACVMKEDAIDWNAFGTYKGAIFVVQSGNLSVEELFAGTCWSSSISILQSLFRLPEM